MALSEYNKEKYEAWKSLKFFHDENGYYTGCVRGFRHYYTEEEVLGFYLKDKKYVETDLFFKRQYYSVGNYDHALLF